MKLYFITFLLFFVSVSVSISANLINDTIKIEVSNDVNEGINLSDAFLKIKKLKRENQLDIIYHIMLHGGIYIFDKTIFLEGNDYNNILITPYKNDSVYFSGGLSIDKKIIEEKYINKTKVYCIDINKTDLKKIANIRSVGFLRPYGESWTEPFINGEPLNLSRWPNDSTLSIGNILFEGSLPYKFDEGNKGAVFSYTEEKINNWKYLDNVWISGYFCHGYADDLLPVKINKQKKAIEALIPHYWGIDNKKPWNRYSFFNVLDELDLNKEYVIDVENQKIYFKYDTKINEIVLSNLDQPFFDLYDVKNIKFENIIFEYSRFLALSMAKCQHVTINNCTFRNIGSAAISVGLGVKPFDKLVEDSVGVLSRGLIGALPQHLYAQTEVNRMAGFDNKIINCKFYNLGSGAVSLGGGNRISLESGNNSIENCLIYSTNRIEKTYRPAIHVTGVGNKVQNCEIYNLPSMAILMHGNNHLILNNYIHDVCYEVDDNGAIYYGRNPTECGNVIRGNFFANIGNDYSCCSVYIDDCAGGLLVENNTFFKAGRYAVLLGGGSDNKILNNLIVNTPIALHVDNRLENWAKHLLDKGGLFEKRLNAVNAFGEIYVKAYPYLLHYKNEINNSPKRNLFWGNKMMNVNKVCDNPQWVDIFQGK